MAALTPQQIFDLARRHHHEGRFAEATALCHQLLSVYPGNASTLHLLGAIAFQAGSPAEAERWLQQAIAANPADAAYHNDLGDVWQSQARYAEAEGCYRQALRLQPRSAPIQNNLGNNFNAQGRLEEAITAYRQALQLEPGFAEIHSNLATVLRRKGALDEAIATLRRAIELKPTYAMAYNNLGHALLDNRQVPEAIAALQQAIALQPDLALAHNNLGTAYKSLGQVDEAIASYRRALDRDPTQVLALTNLANELDQIGERAASLALYERAIASPRCSSAAHSNYLAVLHFGAEMTLAKIAEAHAAYDRRFAEPLRASWQPHTHSREPNRKLRLGFLSPYFGIHPVGFFLVRPLENLDRSQFEIVCYHDGTKDDPLTARLRACATDWHGVHGNSDGQLAQRIREDQIDILFDLAGHTAGNRLLLFARKPAPIQITWLDYVGTTGLAAMDYIVADARQILPEAEPFYRERVLRMPDDYICFDPPLEAPPVGPLPAAANGFVTFASYNIVPKTTGQTIELWSRILRELPEARLTLGNRGFGTPAAVERVRKRFAERAIDPSRIIFQGWVPRAELLAAYNQADIALDTLPYNGGLTTCEAMWMGVPVVTCPGETFASRHGLAHLTAAGVPETIARDPDDYVKIAVDLARDLPRLATLRAGLREKLASSPLCDGERFAKNFGTLLRSAWRRWCQEEASF
ncbi:O-linked N-acetylglucosamine transferase, SPINDLY family protein [Chthoniobacter flavus]|uniref:O-linked N-acetylglucosamine transferase, SPINDLY family protein n=1 Tax=Chthoniobacter flavus TaxID=191863 RepID=UPI0012FABDBB|nr:tetratricopeptide repeat protein [Chthoniobacter flavus]